MKYFTTGLGIFLALSLSRFIPHPPNFTSLLALSFYVPALLGIRYLPVLVFSFFLTDLVIGFHSMTLFTWGSVIIIGLLSRYFILNIHTRISGALLGAVIFFLVTNFGVWVLGSYGYTLNGLLSSYILALPFFGYSLISTIFFSAIIETIYFLFKKKFKKFA